MSRSLYAILNVPRNANIKEIKSSYRKLVRTLHPDVNGGDQSKTDKFREVQHAYQVLVDISKRNDYDRRDSGGTSYSWSSVRGEEVMNSPHRPPAWQTGVRNHRKSATSGSGEANANNTVNKKEHQFDEKVWRAWHYGVDAIVTDAVKQKRDWTQSGSPHQSYFQRKAQNRARAAVEARNTGAASKGSKEAKEAKERADVVENVNRRRQERERQGQAANSGTSSSKSECTIS